MGGHHQVEVIDRRSLHLHQVTEHRIGVDPYPGEPARVVSRTTRGSRRTAPDPPSSLPVGGR
jgi:hypothetical protein